MRHFTSGSVSFERPHADRQLFYREHRDGLYRVITYFLVKMIEEIMLAAVFGFVFAIILWCIIDLQNSFGLFYLVFIANFLSSLGNASMTLRSAVDLHSVHSFRFGLLVLGDCSKYRYSCRWIRNLPDDADPLLWILYKNGRYAGLLGLVFQDLVHQIQLWRLGHQSL